MFVGNAIFKKEIAQLDANKRIDTHPNKAEEESPHNAA